MAMDKRRKSMKRYLPMSDIYPIKPISESWFRYECLLRPIDMGTYANQNTWVHGNDVQVLVAG
jgi:hypothetical protein